MLLTYLHAVAAGAIFPYEKKAGHVVHICAYLLCFCPHVCIALAAFSNVSWASRPLLPECVLDMSVNPPTLLFLLFFFSQTKSLFVCLLLMNTATG